MLQLLNKQGVLNLYTMVVNFAIRQNSGRERIETTQIFPDKLYALSDRIPSNASTQFLRKLLEFATN